MGFLDAKRGIILSEQVMMFRSIVFAVEASGVDICRSGGGELYWGWAIWSTALRSLARVVGDSKDLETDSLVRLVVY